MQYFAIMYMRKESEERMDICICIAESFAVGLKLTQLCKSTTLQYKIKT